MPSIEVILPAPLHRPPTPKRAVTHVWKPLPERPVLGLIDNGKGRACDILEAIARQLEQRGLVASHFMWRKGSAGKPITPAERADMLARADVIVSGVGDCGSCSSCTLHDAVLCSAEGIPSAAVITTPFERLVQATAMNLGVPSIPVMVVEHPIWTRDAAWIDIAAARLCEPLIAKLFAGQEVLQ